MLIDDVTIRVKAGDGGDGAATFRREAWVPRGGPDGGTGGNGGSVYIQGSHNVSDLHQFRYKKLITAQDGGKGKHKNLFGRNAPHLTIIVPIGTKITELESGKTYEIDNDKNPILIARGGMGGRGNTEFKTATNQAPIVAEKGTKGEEKDFRLELRLIADIGFIGVPNAGKSSLLKALTRANPKIAAYPFTTVEPNLGSMGGIIVADIPGLIEGASKGKGLGIKFLKHIEKTKLLVHCIDVLTDDPLKDYTTIRNEFKEYSTALLKKPEIILLTKVDLIEEKKLQEKISELKTLKRTIKIVSIYQPKSLENLKIFLTKVASV